MAEPGARKPPAEGEAAGPRHLLLFGRVPEPGASKTRLAPALGEAGAARLYRAFLSDTVRLARRVEAERRVLWLAGDGEGIDRVGRRFPELPVRRQGDGDLGRRMADALGRAFGEGAGRTLIVGTDHPTLSPSWLGRGFAHLRDEDLVLGPSRDGGYYAVGLRRRAWPRGRELFRSVPWSTDRVLEVTRSRAERAGLGRRELPEWYDVDRPGDLDRLLRDAGRHSRSAEVLRALEWTGG